MNHGTPGRTACQSCERRWRESSTRAMTFVLGDVAFTSQQRSVERRELNTLALRAGRRKPREVSGIVNPRHCVCGRWGRQDWVLGIAGARVHPPRVRCQVIDFHAFVSPLVVIAILVLGIPRTSAAFPTWTVLVLDPTVRAGTGLCCARHDTSRTSPAHGYQCLGGGLFGCLETSGGSCWRRVDVLGRR